MHGQAFVCQFTLSMQSLNFQSKRVLGNLLLLQFELLRQKDQLNTGEGPGSVTLRGARHLNLDACVQFCMVHRTHKRHVYFRANMLLLYFRCNFSDCNVEQQHGVQNDLLLSDRFDFCQPVFKPALQGN